MELIREVIIIVGAVLTIYITEWLKRVYFPNRKSKSFNVNKAFQYLELDRICAEIKNLTRSNRVSIAYFHNGGKFINGVSMDKFTIVGDVKDSNRPSYKRLYTNVMVNRFTYSFHELLLNGRHYIYNSAIDKDTINEEERELALEAYARGVLGVAIFLIKDPVNEYPLGFVMLDFLQAIDKDTINESLIWKYQNKIANLLNQNYKHGDN